MVPRRSKRFYLANRSRSWWVYREFSRTRFPEGSGNRPIGAERNTRFRIEKHEKKKKKNTRQTHELYRARGSCISSFIRTERAPLSFYPGTVRFIRRTVRTRFSFVIIENDVKNTIVSCYRRFLLRGKRHPAPRRMTRVLPFSVSRNPTAGLLIYRAELRLPPCTRKKPRLGNRMQSNTPITKSCYA